MVFIFLRTGFITRTTISDEKIINKDIQDFQDDFWFS